MEDDFQIEYMSLPLEDLQDHYGKLFERYRQMRDDAEADTQRIHEMKRNLETAYAAENYLSQEIEELMRTLASIEKESKGKTKVETELEDLRRQHHTLSTDYSTLQQDYVALSAENAEMRKQLETVKSAKRLSTASIVDAGTEELTQRIASLEGENFSLMKKLEEFQESMVRQTMALAERESNIEVLRDQVTCLEENLRSKREDLDEKTVLLESTQEHLADANARLAMLETKPESVDRKGNSLFAEVDDQRQAMKKLLAAQKKSYIDMKKICHDSQSEIRRLKRENIAMHTELKECSSIFCSADRTYQDKLNERIRQLLGQVEGLEKQLNVSQSRLRDLANDKGVAWLDSMLNFCKQETDELKKQLHGVRIKKASLEEQLRNVQQEMIRWRFEALKTRCVLLDREDLLTEHRIEFKAIRAIEFNITQKEQETARPRIVHASPVTPTERKPQIPSTPLRSIKNENSSAICNTPPENISVKQEVDGESGDSTPVSFKSKVEFKENVGTPQTQPRSTTIPLKSELSSDKYLRESNMQSNSLANELQMALTKNFKREPPGLDAQPGPSILSKQSHALITEDNCEKNVQFSAAGPTVHEISANVSIGLDVTNDGSNKEGQQKAFIKEVRKKPNIIVRHVVVPSKRRPT
ncbi:PREDICTED: protein Spindly [Bactrocera latifrons]|uniref:protein Spindly n=1 Tax=Bactrocera latifrons TaxID=174628 RepID=UPI0008DE3152|nr:PREDICTED: protein Spindly [Bactrocera latifrons]